jgi:hypothetical protein
VAGDLAAGHRDQVLLDDGAVVAGGGAAWVEPAAGRRAGRVGYVAGQVGGQYPAAVGARDRRHQGLGVGVAGTGPDRGGITDFHDPPQVHDRDPVGDLPDDRHVVGD